MSLGGENRSERADEFRLPAEEGNFLAVVSLHRERPDAHDFWDGNWLTARAVLRAGGTSADFPLNIRAEEIAEFCDEARHLYHTLRGTAGFRTTEEQLAIDLQGDGKGHIQCQGEVRDRAGTGNRVTFSMSLDQTMLSSLVSDLERVVQAHPARGNPELK
jgi:hypothetical protein